MPDPNHTHDLEKIQLFDLLSKNPDWILTLKEALDVEAKGHAQALTSVPSFKYYGWSWYEVHTPAPTLNRMVSNRVLDVAYQSRSGTSYLIHAPDIVLEVIHSLETEQVYTPTPTHPMFTKIVGHTNEKTLVQYAIECPKPVHILFQGRPASAKTLFLLDMLSLPEAYYCLAQTLTGAGLAEVLFVQQPKYLLIDEIDRLAGENIGVLNSLMAQGLVVEAKYGKTRSIALSTKVMAAGLRPEKLPADLLSRFVIIRFPPYTEKDFEEVCMKLLPDEGIIIELSALIARECWKLFGTDADIRKAVQIARLGNGDEQKTKLVLEIIRERK